MLSQSTASGRPPRLLPVLAAEISVTRTLRFKFKLNRSPLASLIGPGLQKSTDWDSHIMIGEYLGLGSPRDSAHLDHYADSTLH